MKGKKEDQILVIILSASICHGVFRSHCFYGQQIAYLQNFPFIFQRPSLIISNHYIYHYFSPLITIFKGHHFSHTNRVTSSLPPLLSRPLPHRAPPSQDMVFGFRPGPSSYARNGHFKRSPKCYPQFTLRKLRFHQKITERNNQCIFQHDMFDYKRVSKHI